jgi:hypothetical protein
MTLANCSQCFSFSFAGTKDNPISVAIVEGEEISVESPSAFNEFFTPLAGHFEPAFSRR